MFFRDTFRLISLIGNDSGCEWLSKSVWERESEGCFLLWLIEVTVPAVLADKIKIVLQNNTLEILKSKNEFSYVKSISINNLKHFSNWIDLEEISNGGKIIFNQNIDDESINIKTKLSN